MSSDRFDVLERFAPLFEVPEPSFEAFLRRRDRKQRNQRIAASIVGGAVFVVAFAILLLVFNRTTPPRPAAPIPAPTTAPTEDPEKPKTSATPETPAAPLGRVDATITFGGSRCTLEVANDPINANTQLRLEFVNDSGDPALFRIGRITTDGEWPRANPNAHFREVQASGGALPAGLNSGLGTIGEVLLGGGPQGWATHERDPVGKWGVICYGNRYQGPGAYDVKQFGAVGPLVVE